jgi:hypothetical protein
MAHIGRNWLPLSPSILLWQPIGRFAAFATRSDVGIHATLLDFSSWVILSPVVFILFIQGFVLSPSRSACNVVFLLICCVLGVHTHEITALYKSTLVVYLSHTSSRSSTNQCLYPPNLLHLHRSRFCTSNPGRYLIQTGNIPGLSLYFSTCRSLDFCFAQANSLLILNCCES